jgi:spore coat protein CotH
MIWVAFTQNGDAVAQNYYLYNAPEGGRDRWHQLPWDSNLCFSAHWRDSERVLSPESSKLVDGRNHFGKRLVRVDGLREAYVEHFFEVMDHVLPREIVLHHFERHADHVARDLALDQKRWRRKVDPEGAFAVLTDFIERRPEVLADALRELIADAEPAPPAEPDDVGHDDDLPQP